ncbi:DUF4124 domain-containing protein [Luteibacter sp. 329MFSha]|uniref:DUF4124 domain-containing protein n=1 Tax=Luteibacter sp. 329MFSha TaxID=1798239 RepID=UPI0008C03818|nr:DUF4124 domain-containing protein [Luteibacter sp. 329MFSha]SEW20664.1 hypothetical protein SAMN04515660_3005 [Luteibacter sp. 329MFSha]
MHGARVLLAFAALTAIGPVAAQTVYKCQAGGQTIYQQAPCTKGQHQQTIELQPPAPSGAVAPMPAAPVRSVADDDAAPPPVPAAPPPILYGCIRATDGKAYTSANGQPEPYLAPLGVLGAISQPLADTYGSRDAAIASAPELNRGKGNAAAVATSNYVWVRDQCRQLSPAEACRALRDDADSNQRAIRNAFKSERGPLEAKDAALRGQLAGCG